MYMSEKTETVLNGMEITCRIDEYLTYVLRNMTKLTAEMSAVARNYIRNDPEDICKPLILPGVQKNIKKLALTS